MYSRDLLYRVISWPFCSVTLTEFLRPDVLVQSAPSHVLDRLICRENTVKVSQQFGEETRIFRAVFWYICSWVARRSANRSSPPAVISTEESGKSSRMTEAIQQYFLHEQEGCDDLAYANRRAAGWICVRQRVTGTVGSRTTGTCRCSNVRPATHRHSRRQRHPA